MGKFINQISDESYIHKFIYLGIIIVCGFLAFQFWQANFLSIYDASGHVAAVESVRSFWPSLSGWNARELLGWPQGIFYPSFFHYLTAGLAFGVGIPVAIKIVICVAFIALPISILIFVRSIFSDKNSALLAFLFIFLLITFSPDFLGSSFRSLFHLGLMPNFFVLPVLFLFLASTTKIAKGKFAESGLLLALLILTHLVAAILGVIYLLITFITKIMFGERHLWKKYLLVLIIALLLTAFFWLPFLVNYQLTSVATHGAITSYFSLNLVALLIAVGLVFFSFKKREEKLFCLSFTAFIIVLASVFDAMVFRKFGTSYFFETLNIYRFQIFAYMLLGMGLILLYEKSSWFKKTERLLTIAPILLFGLIILGIFFKNPAKIQTAQVNLAHPEKISGRFLESFRRTESYPVVYEFQTRLSSENKQSPWAFGVFPESSPNAPFIQSLIKSLRPSAYPEGEGASLETKFVDKEKTGSLLNLFGVSYLISLDNEPKNEIGVWTQEDEKKYYNAEKISDGVLFEVVKLPVIPIDKNWEKEVENWWLESGELKYLPYQARKEKFETVCAETLNNAQIKILSVNERQTKFELEIDAAKQVPVLAKISYFPYWKAYQNGSPRAAGEAGKEIPIYRSAPNLMLISANGKVTLEYQEPAWQKGLFLLSAITLFTLTLFLFRNKFSLKD